MEDQLIKLYEEFVDKGMPHSNINIVFLLKHASRIHDRNIGYVLLDMQTWLREEHDIEIVIHPAFYVVTRQDIKHEYSDKTYIDFLGIKINYHKKKYYADVQGPGNELQSKDTYNQALLSGLQEAIKLIE
jgi:hypothetical protein